LITLSFLLSGQALAWGTQGHYQVGRLAFDALDEKASTNLRALLGPDGQSALLEACNWPDAFWETTEGQSSSPLHYVNIPRAATEYDRERDCPQGMCVTEGIKKFAAELADLRLDEERRWRAFAWLCHLVGDLHQPLHAGYKDDRGGNNVNITYRGEEANLHAFWDSILIQEQMECAGSEHAFTMTVPAQNVHGNWWVTETDEWTTESHSLAGSSAYPPTTDIQAEFAEQSWGLIKAQWLKAGSRLARILNSSIGGGEVMVIHRDGETEH
jgi:hypothetical protein